MKRLLSSLSLNPDLATMLLRLLFSGMFTYIGYGMLANYDTILPMFGDIVGNLVIFAEFFCGILIALGLFTRFAIVPAFTTMVVLYIIAPFDAKVHAFIFLIMCLPLFVAGGGKFSLDYILFTKKQPIK